MKTTKNITSALVLCAALASLQCPAEPGAFRAALADPLAWLYADSKVDEVERMDEIDVPANGVVDANILVNGLKPGEPLKFHAVYSSGEWYRMRAVPVARNTGVHGFLEKNPGDNPHVARRAPFEVFDVLEPLACKTIAPYKDGAAVATAATIDSPRETEALRFRLECVPGRVEPYVIRFRVAQGNVARELSLKVNVHPVALPPVGKDSFKYTNWMDFDSMAASHGLEPWSEEHWKMIEKYVRLAARGRQNMGLMRAVFSRGADGEMRMDKEKFARFLDIYNRTGIWYLEGTHLAGFVDGWGSPAFKTAYTTNITTTVEGALALSKLAKMYMEEIKARGLRDRWYQHVADEPGGKNVGEYRITAGIVRRYMPGIRMVDAVEEPSFAGALDVWCPKVNSFERYHALYDSFRTNFGDRVWCYTCCIPGGKWMNRTMDGELLRPALIPWVSVMWDVDGFLHWGYNRWQRNQGQDPFKEPYPKNWGGSNNGHSLPSGDTHIVYPGTDGPWPSARLEATRAGMEDADLLTMLRRRDKERADGLVRRIARGFQDYTPSCRLYREVRRDILRSLAGDAAAPQRVRGGDPFIHLENGTYYLYFSSGDTVGLTVYTSTDLKEWLPDQGRDKFGRAYVNGNGFGKNRFWAPEMHKYKGKYYLFHSAEEKVTVDVGDSPLGPFRNPEKKPFFQEGNIDNSFFLDDDGTPYMLYAHFYAGNEVWICELEKDLLHAKPETQRKLIRAEEDWEMNRADPRFSKWSIAEGPCLVKKDGLYWLTYSSHHVIDDNYNVCLATATNVKGPYVKQGKGPILAPRGKYQCTGHHSLFKDKFGNWKIVFHSRDPGGGPRYTYTADAKFTTKDGHPWIEIGEFQPCLIKKDVRPAANAK